MLFTLPIINLVHLDTCALNYTMYVTTRLSRILPAVNFIHLDTCPLNYTLYVTCWLSQALPPINFILNYHRWLARYSSGIFPFFSIIIVLYCNHSLSVSCRARVLVWCQDSSWGKWSNVERGPKSPSDGWVSFKNGKHFITTKHSTIFSYFTLEYSVMIIEN